jgi:hypothetical protein
MTVTIWLGFHSDETPRINEHPMVVMLMAIPSRQGMSNEVTTNGLPVIMTRGDTQRLS